LAISDESSHSSESDETEGSEQEAVEPFINDESDGAAEDWRTGSSQQAQALPQQPQVCPYLRTGITNPGSVCYPIAFAQMLYNLEGFADMVMGSTPIRQMYLDPAVTF
jgi:hypothetical protein